MYGVNPIYYTAGRGSALRSITTQRLFSTIDSRQFALNMPLFIIKLLRLIISDLIQSSVDRPSPIDSSSGMTGPFGHGIDRMGHSHWPFGQVTGIDR